MRINNRIQNLRNNEVYEIQSQQDSTTRIISTPSINRLNSRITLTYATGRDIDHRERLENLSRKVIHDQAEIGKLGK